MERSGYYEFLRRLANSAMKLRLVVALYLAAVSAQAQLVYTTNGGALTITGYSGIATVVSIPATIGGLPVKSIGGSAFDSQTVMTSVTIPNGVTNIGDQAFINCKGLTSVAIPGSVTNIGDLAFDNCYTLPSITIPNGVIHIGSHAFSYCGMTNITIPASVISIGETPFFGSFYLTAIAVNAQNLHFSGANGVLFDKGQTTLVECPRGLAGSYVIPDGVRDLAVGAFSGCNNLTNVVVPGSVTNLEGFAFYSCTGLKGLYFKGNAPRVVSNVLGANNIATTVFRFPNATGWSSSLAGRPVVVWNPAIQASATNFGIRGNQFGFNITGTAAIVVVLEVSSSPTNEIWSPLQTVTLTNGLYYFSEPLQSTVSGRFYHLTVP